MLSFLNMELIGAGKIFVAITIFIRMQVGVDISKLS